LDVASRFGDVLLNTAKVIFKAHCGRAMPSPNNSFLSLRYNSARPPNRGRNGDLFYGMSNQTNEAFAHIEREYEDVKRRAELQRSNSSGVAR